MGYCATFTRPFYSSNSFRYQLEHTLQTSRVHAITQDLIHCCLFYTGNDYLNKFLFEDLGIV